MRINDKVIALNISFSRKEKIAIAVVVVLIVLTQAQGLVLLTGPGSAIASGYQKNRLTGKYSSYGTSVFNPAAWW
ncbi:MAG: hypothetical protein ACOYON_15110 [Fimbriimonas sp.]